jgi:hypothetical protein
MDPVAGISEQPTRVINGGAGELCPNCQAPLASDQRYCLNCGQRRGKSRFSFDAVAGQAAPATAAPPPPARPSRTSRIIQSFGFVAGVATLLLALGVGVLIGHNGNSGKLQQASTPAQQVIKIQGVGGGGGGGSSSGSGRKSKGKHHSTNNSSKSNVKLTSKQTKAVNKAVGNVLGSGAKNLAPATIQPGQSCSNGTAGCQNGKFTGSFFTGGQN